MDPYQTGQSDMGLHCLSKRLLKQFIRRQKQTNFVVIGAFRFRFFVLSGLDFFFSI